MTEEERRKRYSRDVELTPELEDWIMRAVNAQRAGWPVPEPPRTADSQEFAPAYVDPRSESLAQTPALVRPIAGMMDKLFRPGREGVANEMNREYMENLPISQARQQKVTSEGLLEELRARAMRGDTLAIDKLSKFRTADKPSSSAANPLADFYRQQAAGGEAGRDSAGSARRTAGDAPEEADGVAEEPLTTLPDQSRFSDGGWNRRGARALNRERALARNAVSQLAAAKEDLERLDKEISAGGSSGNNPRMGFRAFDEDKLLAKQAERTKVEDNIRSLENKIAEFQGRPAAGSPGATTAGQNQ